MYLINVQTMELELFHDNRGLRYAILSHRWRDGEVLFTDMADGTAHLKPGWTKLQRFCEQAALAEYRYAWCDTCCIDKRSSAELDEALNSMYEWYRGAGECYAYLFDADDVADLEGTAWFTRGWCLQELLAPRALTFYGRNWQVIGTRDQLAERISQLTGIHEGALRGAALDGYSVAQRMAWAADRETTRVEDVAYSLLGLFGVNMPLLYGEGIRAFTRLQEEILRRSNDQSIFVHSSSGWLATSPADFRESSRIVPSRTRLIGEPYTLTNMGISIELILHVWAMESYMALLDCQYLDTEPGRDGDVPQNIVVFVQLAPKDEGKTDRIMRFMVDGKFWARKPLTLDTPSFQSRFLLPLDQRTPPRPKRYGFWIRQVEGVQDWVKNSRIWAISWNNFADGMLEIPPGTHATAGVVVYELDKGANGKPFRLMVHLGFTPYSVPVINVKFNTSIVAHSVHGHPIDARGPRAFSYHFSQDITPEWDPINYKTVLEDTRWMRGAGPGGPPNVMSSTSRDTPLRQMSTFGFDGCYAVACQNMEVKGVDTWVVDVRWCDGEKGRPEHSDLVMQDRLGCDGCRSRPGGKRFLCLECKNYTLCRKCFGNVAAHHPFEHSFEQLEYDYY